MYNYTSGDIFAKDTDAFLADFKKHFGFLFIPKGGLIYRLVVRDPEVRQIHRDEFPIIKDLLSKRFSNNVIISERKSLNAFSDWVCSIFSHISTYYCSNPDARKNSYVHLAVFFLMLANYFQHEYMLKKSKKSPKERLYRDKYGNIINWHLDIEPNSQDEYEWEKLSYRNTYEIIARDAMERVLHWFRQLPRDKSTTELVHFLIPALPTGLKGIIESSGTSSIIRD